ncbi:MAG: hypothetical protein AB7F32_05005 [Victivallaceae bacterium]
MDEKSKCGICGQMEYDDHMVQDAEVGAACRRHYSPEELCPFRPAVKAILDELERAKKIHPEYPRNAVMRAIKVTKAAVEVIKSAHDLKVGDGTDDEVKTKLIQTAAMCLRMLEAMEG